MLAVALWFALQIPGPAGVQYLLDRLRQDEEASLYIRWTLEAQEFCARVSVPAYYYEEEIPDERAFSVYACGILWLALRCSNFSRATCVVRVDSGHWVGCCGGQEGYLSGCYANGEVDWDDHARHFFWQDSFTQMRDVSIVDDRGEEAPFLPIKLAHTFENRPLPEVDNVRCRKYIKT